MNDIQVYLSMGLALCLVAMRVLGYVGYKKTRSMADFAIAGAKMGTVTLGVPVAATFFSAATFVGHTLPHGEERHDRKHGPR